MLGKSPLIKVFALFVVGIILPAGFLVYLGSFVYPFRKPPS